MNSGSPPLDNGDSAYFPSELKYNKLDEYEENSDLLRAEAMALATPLSMEYSDKFYSSLKNIEMTCSAEVESICGPSDSTMMISNIMSSFDQIGSSSEDPIIFFMGMPGGMDVDNLPYSLNRRLTEEIKSSVTANNGLKFLQSVRDAFLNRFPTSKSNDMESIREVPQPGVMKVRPVAKPKEVGHIPVSPPPVIEPINAMARAPLNNRFRSDPHAGFRGSSKRNQVGSDSRIPLGPPPELEPIDDPRTMKAAHSGRMNRVRSADPRDKRSVASIPLSPGPVPEPILDDPMMMKAPLLVRNNLVRDSHVDHKLVVDTDIPISPGPVFEPIGDDSIMSRRDAKLRVTSLRGPAGVAELVKRSQIFVHEHARKLFMSSPVMFGDHDSSSGGSGSDSGSDSGSEGDAAGSHHHHHGHHKYHSHHDEQLGFEDNVYTGALGFGADGDLCVYENFDQLSAPCQTVVVDHYRLRQEYWEESKPPCSGLGIMLWVLVFALGYLVCRRLCMNRCKHKKDMKKIMDTIRENPALKASIEAEAGVIMPEMKSCPSSRICRGLVLVLLTLLSAFMIAVSSLLFTVSILSAMMPPPDEYGEQPDAQPPSVAFAIFVLLCVCSAEIGLFFLIFRGYRRSNAPVNTTAYATTDMSFNSSASAPLLPDQPSSPSNPSSSNRFSRYLTWVPPRSSFPGWSTFLSNNHAESGYVPLMSDDTQHGISSSMPLQSEMVRIVQHHAHPQPDMVLRPMTPYTPYAGVMVANRHDGDLMAAAQPVSHIRMF